MIFDLLLRTGVVVGVVIVTKRLGIWDSSDQTVEFYNTHLNNAKPYATQTCEYLNLHVPDLPPDRKPTFLGIYLWNHGVLNLCNFFRAIPIYVNKVIEVVPGYVSKYASLARQYYDDYKKKRAEEKEKQSKKLEIDEGPLVMPMTPDSKSDKYCEIPPGLVPKDDGCALNSPGKCPTLKCPPKPKCECTKCKKRESEGWNDNKSKCENRTQYKNELETKCDCPKCEKREEEGWKDNKPKCKAKMPPEMPPANDEPSKCKCPKNISGSTEDNLRKAGILNNEPIESFYDERQRSK